MSLPVFIYLVGITEPILIKWATPGIMMNIGGGFNDFRVRDDWPIVVVFMMILNFLLPIITCLIIWFINLKKSIMTCTNFSTD